MARTRKPPAAASNAAKPAAKVETKKTITKAKASTVPPKSSAPNGVTKKTVAKAPAKKTKVAEPKITKKEPISQAKPAETESEASRETSPGSPPRTTTVKLPSHIKRKRDVDEEGPIRKKATKSPTEKKSEPEINSPPTQKLVLFSCGEGSAGELGLGPKAVDVKRPRLNDFLTKAGVVQVAAGGMHSIALTEDNKLLTWGINDQGTLGRSSEWDAPTRDADASSDDEDDEDLNPLESTPGPVDPSNFPEGTKFSQVAAGDSCTFALTTTGHVYGWGTFRDSNGIYGFTLDKDNKIIKEVHRPILIRSLKNIVEIGAGADFAVALDKSGNVFAWGTGQQDQLGRRLVERRKKEALVPTHVATPRRKITHIFSGSNHTFALDQDKNVWGWGLNNYGQVGIPDNAGEDAASITAPTKVQFFAGRNIKQLSPGTHHSLAVGEDGKCYVWGRFDAERIGIKESDLPINDPAQVKLGEKGEVRIVLTPQTLPMEAAYASAGSGHSLVASKKGQLYAWGYNGTYQCGLGKDIEDVSEATLVENTATLGKKFTWVGAGGQYSLFGALPDAS
jgi:regulator of chromosome condensation